jgi:hypothetical protein
MANDFQKKVPSKNEKMIYELFMQMQGLERSMFTNSSLLIILALEAGIKPEKLADLLVNGNDKIKTYSAQINEAIGKLEKEKHPEPEHDHNHEGHDHGDHEHPEESPKAEENK